MFRPEIRLERSAEIFGGNALLRAKFVLDELLLSEAERLQDCWRA